MRKSSSGQDPNVASVETAGSSPAFRSKFTRWRSQDSKASARKADHRECNSPRHLQSFEKNFFAGTAQWEEGGPGKSVIGVRIAAPAPLLWFNGKSRYGKLLV